MRLPLAVCILLVQQNAFAAPSKILDQTHGGVAPDVPEVVLAIGGGFLIAGTSDSGVSGNKSTPGQGLSDYWVVKTDLGGNKIWESTFGGTQAEFLHDAVATPDGGFLLVGESYSGISGNKAVASFGATDVWLVKIDASGNKVWEHGYGGTEEDAGTVIIKSGVLGDTGFYIGGTSESPMSGNKTAPSKGAFDYWIIKIDENGNALWDRSYGGLNSDILNTMVSLPSGELLLLGSSSSQAGHDKTGINFGASDSWLVKTDAGGTRLWDRTYGGSSFDSGIDLVMIGSDLLILGTSSSPVNTGNKTSLSYGNNLIPDYWAMRTSPTGAKLWEKSYGGTGHDSARRIALIDSTTAVLGGTSDSDVLVFGGKTAPSKGSFDNWLITIDTSNGTKASWDQAFGGSAEEYLGDFICSTLQYRCVLVSATLSPASGDISTGTVGWEDYWLVRLIEQ